MPDATRHQPTAEDCARVKMARVTVNGFSAFRHSKSANQQIGLQEEIDMKFSGHFKLIDIACTEEQTASFAELHQDQYHPDNSRFRRFSHFRLQYQNNAWLVERLPARPFVQAKQNNGLSGGVKRYFKPILVDVSELILAGARAALPDTDSSWLVSINQFRVVTTQSESGTPVPEGVHRDGEDMIFMVCAGRENVDGGVSKVYDDEMTEIFTGQLMPGQGMLVNDAISYHDASRITLKPGKEFGYRDLFTIGYSDWNRGMYGAEFEIEHTGSEADLSLLTED